MTSRMRLIDADALKKQIEDFHCKNCDNYNFVRCRACSIDNAISYLDEAPTVNGWISVKDRLPAEGQDVLVYMERNAWDDHGLHFRKKDIEKGWQINGTWHCDGCSRVLGLYWMPLPEPPEVSE